MPRNELKNLDLVGKKPSSGNYKQPCRLTLNDTRSHGCDITSDNSIAEKDRIIDKSTNILLKDHEKSTINHYALKAPQKQTLRT